MAVYHSEIDPFAAAWLRELIKAGLIAPGIIDERSIEDVRPDELAGFAQCHFFAGIGGWPLALALAGWPTDRPIWTGSCPCQPFSAAGKGGGFADERHLWPAFDWLIGQCRPDIVLGEQVEGPAGRAWLDLVATDLEGHGYAFGTAVFPAAGVGAPQIRHRTYWMAVSGSERFKGQQIRLQPRQPRQAGFEVAGDGPFSRLACAVQGERGRRPNIDESESYRQAAGWLESDRGAWVDCEAGRMAVSDEQGSGWRGIQRPGEGVCAGAWAARERSAGLCEAGVAGPVNGFWRASDWLYCRDDKWRPVEPSAFPLVASLSKGMGSGSDIGASFDENDTAEARVMRLRGYGNAVNVYQAAAFVEAAMGALK